MASRKTGLSALYSQESQSIDDLYKRYGPRYRTLAVLAVGFGTIAVMLLSTIVNVAIPQIMVDFHIDQNMAQWLATGYLASATVSMLMSSWCLRRYGVKSTFIASSIVVLLSSLMSGLSPNAPVLILARIIQGLAYGFFLPVSMYVMTQVFPANRQGTAMGIFGILAVFGPAVGPYVGGIAVENLGWRSVFFLPLPLSIISLPLSMLFLPGRNKQENPGNMDWLGLAWLSLTVIHLLLGFNNAQKFGWDSTVATYCFSAASVLGWIFYRRQKKVTSPLLDLTLFQNRNFAVAAIISFLYGGALFGGMYLIPLYLQTSMDLGPLDAGLALLPAGLILAVAFPISGHLSDRLPPQGLIISGMILLGFSYCIMTWSTPATPLATICEWLIIGRIGMAAAMPALNMSAFSTLPQQQLTQASGTINFVRQIGGAFGVNLTSVYLDYREHHWVQQIAQSTDTLNIGEDPAHLALSLSYLDTFMISGILILLTIIPTLMLQKPKHGLK